MPITTPETEKLFKMYSAALEVKGAAKVSLAALSDADCRARQYILPNTELFGKLKDALESVRALLDEASDTVASERPIRIEERGYSAVDREVGAFGHSCGCDDSCSGGNCGNCSKP